VTPQLVASFMAAITLLESSIYTPIEHSKFMPPLLGTLAQVSLMTNNHLIKIFV